MMLMVNIMPSLIAIIDAVPIPARMSWRSTWGDGIRTNRESPRWSEAHLLSSLAAKPDAARAGLAAGLSQTFRHGTGGRMAKSQGQ
jgi:hypothetical protein